MIIYLEINKLTIFSVGVPHRKGVGHPQDLNKYHNNHQNIEMAWLITDIYHRTRVIIEFGLFHSYFTFLTHPPSPTCLHENYGN